MATAARFRGRLDAVLLAICVALSLIALALPVSSREPIAGALRSTAVSPLIGLQTGAQTWRSAWSSREHAALERDSLSLRAMQAEALLSENDQLRKLIGLARRLESGFVPAEALQDSDKLDIVTSVVLSAGSNAGVRRYSTVIAPEGLVGMVVTVNPTMSVANLYTNPDFRASAMTRDGSAFGFVYPHLQQGGLSRNRQYMLELRGVLHRVPLAPGTPIFTSGFGGTAPRGILIGTVTSELEAMEGLWRSYLLAPAVNPAKLGQVLILTPQRASQGVGNIWTSAVGMDSATRSINAAGDSLAREAARLESRARIAVLDSVKRATTDSLFRIYGFPPGGSAIDTMGGRGAARAPLPPRAPATTATPLQGTPRPTDTTRPPPVSVPPDTTRPPPVGAPPDTTRPPSPPTIPPPPIVPPPTP